jgi:hypothetical protein
VVKGGSSSDKGLEIFRALVPSGSVSCWGHRVRLMKAVVASSEYIESSFLLLLDLVCLSLFGLLLPMDVLLLVLA